jgi:hypothetical protein
MNKTYADDVVVRRAVAGERVRMNLREREAVISWLYTHERLSDRAIAARIGAWPNSVLRTRHRLGLPAIYDSGRNFIG